MHGLLIGTKPILDPPAWSVEIEIQFYIIAHNSSTRSIPALSLIVILIALSSYS
jgi:peptidoglycan/LPS O-acetylase OafA/YrhL